VDKKTVYAIVPKGAVITGIEKVFEDIYRNPDDATISVHYGLPEVQDTLRELRENLCGEFEAYKFEYVMTKIK